MGSFSLLRFIAPSQACAKKLNLNALNHKIKTKVSRGFLGKRNLLKLRRGGEKILGLGWNRIKAHFIHTCLKFWKDQNILTELKKKNLKDPATVVSQPQSPACSRPLGNSSPFSVVSLSHLKSVWG